MSAAASNSGPAIAATTSQVFIAVSRGQVAEQKLHACLGQGQRAEVFLVPPLELGPGVGMALSAQVFEGIGRRHTAEASAHEQVCAVRQPFEEAAPIGIAYAGRIRDRSR